MAYEGMIFRALAENTELDFALDNRWDMVHFIGFNALNECERVLMSRIKKARVRQGSTGIMTTLISKNPKLNSAGFFLRDDLKIFGK